MFTITSLQESDLEEVYQQICLSRGHLQDLGWVAECSWDRFYRHYQAIVLQKKLSIFTIRVDGRVAGAVEIADRIDHYVVGYWLGVAYRGQGIATEAVKSVINQLDNKPIVADTLIENPASSQVLERLGFKLEKTSETNCFYRLTDHK
jgi:RimJ/RimL family protein N-acetyltransferase